MLLTAFAFSSNPTDLATLMIQCRKTWNSANFCYTRKSTGLQLSTKTHMLSCDVTEAFSVYCLNYPSQRIRVNPNDTWPVLYSYSDNF